MVFHSSLPVLSCILSLPLIQALSNVTVDSSDKAILYSPPGSWTAQGWDNSTSPPDTQLASQGTWQYASTDATDGTEYENNVTFSTTFSGSALYVFAILQSGTFTAVNFALNGTHVGSYSRIPDITSTFVYNTTIYANPSLPQGKHVFALSLSQTDRSAFFFDYLVYSADEEKILSSGGSSATPMPSSFLTVPSAPTPVPFGNAPDVSLTPENTSMVFTTSEDPLTETPATTLAVQENPSSSFISVSTRSTSQGSASRSADTSSTAPSKSNVLVIAAAAGSGGAVLVLLIFTTCYIRYKRTKRYHIDPYVTPDATPSNTPNYQDVFTKLPTSSSSARPFIARLSFQTFAESTTTGVTLTDEIFPLPSEVEDVYSQLEALSVEVQKFRETEEVSEEHRFSRRVRAVTQDVHVNIDQLRMEIQRLRWRSGTNTGTGVTTADVDLMHMLREVDMLRAELHDAVRQTDNDSSIERLPSYHSRKTNHGYTADDIPPPLPTRRVFGLDSKTRA